MIRYKEKERIIGLLDDVIGMIKLHIINIEEQIERCEKQKIKVEGELKELLRLL